MSTSIGYVAIVGAIPQLAKVVQRMLDEAEAEFLYGPAIQAEPVGMAELQGMLAKHEPVKPQPVKPFIRQQFGRTGKGERKRNRKHRWG